MTGHIEGILNFKLKKPAGLGFGMAFACLFALPCWAQGNAAGDKAAACRYNQKNPMTSGQAKLSAKERKIHRIWFNSYYPGGRGEFGFVCHIDLKRGDDAYLWQDDGSAILITAKETGDSLQLSRDKKGYWLNFAQFKNLSPYCGPGATVPLDVFIPLGGGACKIRLPPP